MPISGIVIYSNIKTRILSCFRLLYGDHHTRKRRGHIELSSLFLLDSSFSEVLKNNTVVRLFKLQEKDKFVLAKSLFFILSLIGLFLTCT